MYNVVCSLLLLYNQLDYLVFNINGIFNIVSKNNFLL